MIKNFLSKIFQQEERFGLVFNPEQENDPRNLRYEDLAPLGGEIPEFGDVEIDPITYNQGSVAACTTHSTAHAVRQVMRIAVSPRYAWNRIKTDSKYPSSQLSWGAFMIDSIKLQINEGICDYDLAPNEFTNDPAKYLDLKVTDEMKRNAETNKGGAYLFVTSGAKNSLDKFDDIVLYLAGRGAPVKVAVNWFSSYNRVRYTGGVVPTTIPTGKYVGHDMLAVAWKRINGHEYLAFRNSYGSAWGDKGRVWLPKGFFDPRSAIAVLNTIERDALDILIPVPEKDRNIFKEKFAADELRRILYAKFPLSVAHGAKTANNEARALAGRMWLLLVQAVTYRGFTNTDVINFLYARSRNKTATKAYSLDFSKTK